MSIPTTASIANYLGTRLEFLRTCNAAIENHIEAEKRPLLDLDTTDANDERALGVGLHRLDCMIGLSFRYSMFVAYCTFCEESLRIISQALIPTYEGEFQKQKRGNWLQKHRRLLMAHGVDLNQRPAQLQQLLDAVPIRHCIVHAWGDMTQARNRAEIDQVVKRSKHFVVTPDQFICLDDKAIPAMGIAAREFFQFVLNEAGVSDAPVPTRKLPQV